MKKIIIGVSVLPVLLFAVVAQAQDRDAGRGVEAGMREQQETMLESIDTAVGDSQNLLQDRAGETGDRREETQEMQDQTREATQEMRDGVVDENRAQREDRAGQAELARDNRAEQARERGDEGIFRAQERKESAMKLIEARRNEIESEVSARREALEARRQEMLQNTEERKAQLQEERAVRVAGMLSNMLTGFLNSLDRMADISDRLENRIEALAETEVDVAEALVALDYANELLASNMAQIEAIRLELGEAIQGELSVGYIRELISDLKDNILATREAFRAVISAINN